MKETNEKVYRCDYCNRAMISKGFMKVHEKMCKKNPKNRHKCFQYCIHLVKDIACDEVFFYCPKIKKDLYSYKLERFNRNSERLKELMRMPLECNFYELDRKHFDYEPEKSRPF